MHCGLYEVYERCILEIGSEQVRIVKLPLPITQTLNLDTTIGLSLTHYKLILISATTKKKKLRRSHWKVKHSKGLNVNNRLAA